MILVVLFTVRLYKVLLVELHLLIKDLLGHKQKLMNV